MDDTEKLASLRRLAASPASALEIGKAAEHLACADLILQGYRVFLSDQGLPYDLVVDLAGRLIRVQVKAACFAKNVNSQGREERIAYNWAVRRRGKNGKGERLTDALCDVVALVALDVRIIAWLPLRECGQTIQLHPPGAIRTSVGGPLTYDGDVSCFPFSDAIEGQRNYRRGEVGECPNGHVYSPENTYFSKGKYRNCRKCAAERTARSRRASTS